MRRIINIYESCKTPIRVAYFAFACLAIGYFISSPSVNIFYTFKSNVMLFMAEFFLNIGKFIVMNLPLIFMLNVVCKKENNAAPVVMALVGYFTFTVTTMLVANQSLSAQAYSTGYGINSIFNAISTNRLPLETGMIGALIVAYATRVSFILSRHRSAINLSNIFAKDTAGIVYNVILCFVLGVLVSYGYPIVYRRIQTIISFIGEDLLDPMRIGLYSVLDRILSMLGLGNIIRYPFWFTSLGGSYQNTLTGQAILGDVPIFSFVKQNNASYLGAGRFVTPYYVINMFIIPAIYLGIFTSISDTKQRNALLLTFIFGIGLSIVMGNPLPLELFLLFTAPVLLGIYLMIVAAVSYCLVAFEAFLGFETTLANISVCLPGTFPDFIINLRNVNYTRTLTIIAMVGVIAFALMFFATIIFYRFIVFDFANTGTGNDLVKKIIDAVGGKDNIDYAAAGLLELNVYLINPDLANIEKLRKINIRRINEIKDGISFYFGAPSYAISRRINKRISS